MLRMYILYFKRCTLYKFIDINSVLFCSAMQWVKITHMLGSLHLIQLIYT